MNTIPFYRGYLYTALAHEAQMTPEQAECVLAKFDKVAGAGGAEMAFAITMEAYANEDTKAASLTVKESIRQALEKFNKEHRGVSKNPLSRLRETIKSFNAALDKCAIEINGQPLTREDIDRIKIKVPGFIAQTTYTATASLKNGKAAKMILEVTG